MKTTFARTDLAKFCQVSHPLIVMVVLLLTDGYLADEEASQDQMTDTLPPEMEMACHRRFNGSIWCAPMKKWEPYGNNASANRTSANLVTESDEYGTGLRLSPPGVSRERPPSDDEDGIALDLPDSFSWKDVVSPVKHQGKCGSCVAFATMGAVEACYRRNTGKFYDFSEQELIDCGYGHMDADGCHSAELESYLDWMMEDDVNPEAEEQYPYKYLEQNFTCPPGMGSADKNLDIRVTNYFSIKEGTEEKLQEWVATKGPIISALGVGDKFKEYTGGVFDGCPPDPELNHAVLVVGYGTTNEGEDYWHIKNSWGVGWGDDGYMWLKRGVSMCNIGSKLAGVECGSKVEKEDNRQDEDGMNL